MAQTIIMRFLMSAVSLLVLDKGLLGKSALEWRLDTPCFIYTHSIFFLFGTLLGSPGQDTRSDWVAG